MMPTISKASGMGGLESLEPVQRTGREPDLDLVARTDEIDPALWHCFGTVMFHCSVSVHAVSKDQLVKNQELKLPIILGWKQAGFETITKK
jgi:hypothetical protein